MFGFLFRRMPDETLSELSDYIRLNYRKPVSPGRDPGIRYSLSEPDTKTEAENPALSCVRYSIPETPEEQMEQKAREEERRKQAFCYRLSSMIEEKGLKASDFYKKADITRKLFSAMHCNDFYQPDKETAIKCCLAMEMDKETAESMLASAGYALSDAKVSDLVIRYCIEKKIYKIWQVNLLLEKSGEKPMR